MINIINMFSFIHEYDYFYIKKFFTEIQVYCSKIKNETTVMRKPND